MARLIHLELLTDFFNKIGQEATLPHYQSGWPQVIDSVIALPVTVSCLFCLDEALLDHHLMQETAGCSAVSIEINS